MKDIKTKLGQSISVAIPLIEEIVDKKHIPICVIGCRVESKKTLYFHFATIDDKPETEEIIYNACKAIVEKFKDKYEINNP